MGLDFEESAAPFSRGPELFVRRLKCGESATFTILSEKFWGLRVHWDGRGRRTSPHLRKKDVCPGCKYGWPSKWKGYLHVLAGAGEEIFEFTPVMYDQITMAIGAGVPLRGNRFHMSRGQGDRSRVRFTIQAHYSQLPRQKPLPAERDPKVSLLELWGLGDVVLGDDSPNVVPFSEAM